MEIMEILRMAIFVIFVMIITGVFMRIHQRICEEMGIFELLDKLWVAIVKFFAKVKSKSKGD